MISDCLGAAGLALGLAALALTALFCVDSQWQTAVTALTVAVLARAAWTVGSAAHRREF